MYARHRDEAAGRLDGFEPGREGPGVRETRELYERLSRASSAREPAGTRPVRLPRLSDSSGPDGFAASGSVSYYDGHMPYSYNLRRNRPAAQDSIHTVAQYYPTYSSAASSHAQSPPLGDAHSSTSSAKYFETTTYKPPSVAQSQPTDARIGATTGTVVTVPETDILDSDSEGDDDVVKSCADECGMDRAMDYENDAGVSSSEETDDPEVLALFEREEIVEKYERGPEQDGIDPWENPNFDLHKKTDSKEELTAEKERRGQAREARRLEKWRTMHNEWMHRTPVKLAERIWKGIPDAYRMPLLNIEDYKKPAGNIYNELLMRAQLLSKEVKQIDLDVNRTYRDNVAFMKRYDISQKRLFNILAAYSVFNAEVGYCQGMNHICALLILYLSDDEDAFWGLHSLLCSRKYAMHGFFVPSFPKLHRFQDHFLNRILPKYAPRVNRHFERIGMPPIYLTKWWFGCFLDRVPFQLCMRIWDVFLWAGDCVLIAMALNIMKMHEKRICKMSLEQFMEFNQREMPADFGFADDAVMQSLRKWLEKLQDDKLALPPRREDDVSELPTQPLGQILKRSMVDIRMDVAEIHSRSSRANSLAGRSPALRQRRQRRPEQSAMSQSVNALPNTSLASPGVRRPPPESAGPSAEAGAAPGPRPAPATPGLSSEPFKRKPSFRNGRSPAPMPIPDADGFVPMAAAKSRHSLYDNVTPSTTPSSGSHPAHRLPTHSRETSGTDSKVLRAANNVTYVSVPGEPDPPHPPSPPPDYDTADARR